MADAVLEARQGESMADMPAEQAEEVAEEAADEE
jgi:hypothetical protein